MSRDKAKDEKDHRKDFDPKGEDAMRADIKRELRQEFQQLYAAREAVKPIVGDVSMALDSAEGVYGFALKHLGINTEGVPPEMFGTLFEVHQNASKKPARPTLAQDSNVIDFDSEFSASKRRA